MTDTNKSPGAGDERVVFDGSTVDPRTLAEGALPFPMLERIGDVLVVDDEPMMVMIMTRILEKLGIIRVDTSPDPLDALQKLRDKRYGLIVSDIQMEPLSGLDLFRGTKTTENARTPFLLTTGTYDAKVAVDAKAAGASWFILKPFSVDQMRRKLREMIHV